MADGVGANFNVGNVSVNAGDLKHLADDLASVIDSQGSDAIQRQYDSETGSLTATSVQDSDSDGVVSAEELKKASSVEEIELDEESKALIAELITQFDSMLINGNALIDAVTNAENAHDVNTLQIIFSNAPDKLA